MMKLKPMVYSHVFNYKLLEVSTYKGYRYCIISYGWYPCCYIELTEGKPYFESQEYEDIDINCHGGITFLDWGLSRGENEEPRQEIFPDSSKVIGWDYSHLGDYSGLILFSSNKFGAHKWTMSELKEDCIDVIEQLVLLEQPERFYS